MSLHRSRFLVLLTGALALACLASLALTARADAFIYWTDAGTQSIGRANLDGTGVDVDFIAGLTDVGPIAIDNSFIYWAHRSGSGIGRARLDGSGVDQDFIPDTGPYVVTGLCVSKEHLFWVVRQADIEDRTSPGYWNSYIYRADVDGTDVQLPWITGTGPIPMAGCAVMGQRLFYTCGVVTEWGAQYPDFWWGCNSVGNADGDPVDHYESPKDHFWAAGVAAGDSYFYWLNNEGIWRKYAGWITYDHVAAASDVPGADGGLAKQDEYLFWTDDNGSRIGRIKKSGNDSDPNFLTAPVTPVGAAADAGKPAKVTGLSRVVGKRGSLVVIRGRNFGARRGSGAVRFGSASCGRYVSWSDHKILVAVPAKAPAGRAQLVVQTKYGPSAPRWFTVQR